jgi:hypothetical protein
MTDENMKNEILKEFKRVFGGKFDKLMVKNIIK